MKGENLQPWIKSQIRFALGFGRVAARPIDRSSRFPEYFKAIFRREEVGGVLQFAAAGASGVNDQINTNAAATQFHDRWLRVDRVQSWMPPFDSSVICPPSWRYKSDLSLALSSSSLLPSSTTSIPAGHAQLRKTRVDSYCWYIIGIY